MVAVVGLTSRWLATGVDEVRASNVSTSVRAEMRLSSGISRSTLANLATSRKTPTPARATPSSADGPVGPTTLNTKFRAVKITRIAADNVDMAASRGARGSWTT